MTLKVVQDTSTNWTNAEWRIIDRMKKNYSEMDERSGRPWKLGDDILALAPIGEQYVNTGRDVLIKDAALEVGCAPRTLETYGATAAAWEASFRNDAVIYSVFTVLRSEPDRIKLLARLIKDYGAENITKDLASQAIGREADPRHQGLKERVTVFAAQLDRFMDQRLYSADRLALEQLRLKIDILLGDAEEEAI